MPTHDNNPSVIMASPIVVIEYGKEYADHDGFQTKDSFSHGKHM